MIRKLFRWKKWYAVTFFTNNGYGNSGYNRAFCWSYCLDAEQVQTWEKEICRLNDLRGSAIINVVPLKNGKGITINGIPQ